MSPLRGFTLLCGLYINMECMSYGLVWVGDLVNLLPVAQRTNALTYGVVERT